MIINDQLEVLFYKALELPAAKRESFLDESCGNDLTLKKEIASLLLSASKSTSYFDALSHELCALDSPHKKSNFSGQSQYLRSIGPWRLLSILGRGGMGVVYLAERADQQHTKRYALKLLPLGADDPISRYRFESERKILAQLDHENITRFVDSGMTEEGIPYFVMDYIKGIQIQQYCNEKKLSIEKKLKLFLEIGHAVQYAHDHLVIHRDLKPNNILVGENGKIKLLDFGIAKFLENETQHIELTRVAHCPLTYAYASPEMLRGDPVSTTTDVYSLGIMLYELLSGRRPFNTNSNLENSSDNQHNFAAEKPSNKTTDAETKRLLKGDLDTIILKAISPLPANRYSSAKDLVSDIECYLNGFPIRARPYNTTYYVKKFIHRHMAATIASAGFVVVLLFSTAFSLQKMHEAQQQRDLARYQQRHVQATNDFLNLLFEEIGPEGKPLTLEELIDRGVSMLDKQFEFKPKFVGYMLFELSQAYRSLGKQNKMKDLLTKAAEVAHQQSDGDLLSIVLCTQAFEYVGLDREFSHQQYEAAMYEQTRLSRPSLTSEVVCNHAKATLLESRGDLTGALQVIENTLLRLNEADSANGSLHFLLANRKTLLHYNLGNREKVLESNKELLHLYEQTGRSSTIGYLIITQNRAVLLDMVGEILESVNLRRRILERFKSTQGQKLLPPKFVMRYADGLVRLGRYDEALQLYEKHIDLIIREGDPLQVARFRTQMGKTFSHKRMFEKAEQQLQAAETEYVKSAVLNQRQLNKISLARITKLRQKGETSAAFKAVEELLMSMEYPKITTGFLLSQTLKEAGEISLATNNTKAAQQYIDAFHSSAVSLARSPENSADVGYALLLKAKLNLSKGLTEDAIGQLITAEKTLSSSAGLEHPHRKEAAHLIKAHLDHNSSNHTNRVANLHKRN